MEKSTKQRWLLNRKDYKKRRKMRKWLWSRLTAIEFHQVKSTSQWSAEEALLILATAVVSKIHPLAVRFFLLPHIPPPQQGQIQFPQITHPQQGQMLLPQVTTWVEYRPTAGEPIDPQKLSNIVSEI